MGGKPEAAHKLRLESRRGQHGMQQNRPVRRVAVTLGQGGVGVGKLASAAIR